MADQPYLAVLAVIEGGETVKDDVAARFGVRRQTVHDWLAKSEAGGLKVLAHDRNACAGTEVPGPSRAVNETALR